MGEILETLGAEGPGRDLCGYTFFRPTFREMAVFEKWLEDGARAQALAWKDMVEPNVFATQLQSTGMLIAQGQYSWSTDPKSECGQALGNPPGKVRLLHIIASRVRAVKVEDIKTAYFANRQEFDDLLAWMLNTVPNSLPPEAGESTTANPASGTTPTRNPATV